jgi:uncharacterized protein YcbX
VRLVEIARYPVKSLQGELLSRGEIERDGLRGDRRWGIRDETTGKVLTARRAPELLFAAATLAPDDLPVITLPTGVVCEGPGGETDAALSHWLGKPVRLVAAGNVPPARAEFFADATDDTSEAIEWTMPAGRFVDASPLLVLTTASLRAAEGLYPGGDWSARRFRANLLLDAEAGGWVEDAWCGTSVLHIGAVRLSPQELCVRCTMITRPQPDLGEDRDLFRTLARHHGARFGAWTAVAGTGTVAVGAHVDVEPLAATPPADQPLIVSQRRADDADRQPLDLAE